MDQSKISYFFESIKPTKLDKKKISRWLVKVCDDENYKIDSLTIIFCSDQYLLEMNQQHLNHDYFTDIITFDLSDEAGIVEGELYISLDRVAENATDRDIPMETELYRVIVHGLLHLIGYNDKSAHEQKIMRSKEDASLSLLAEF